MLQERGKITQVDLARVSASLSGITEAFAGAFGCSWLDYRSAMVNVLPFAGGEILVMKERFSETDLHMALETVEKALTQIEAHERQYVKRGVETNRPVIVFRYSSSTFHKTDSGRHALRLLFSWCERVRSQGLAHIIFTGNERLVFVRELPLPFSLLPAPRKCSVKHILLRTVCSSQKIIFYPC